MRFAAPRPAGPLIASVALIGAALCGTPAHASVTRPDPSRLAADLAHKLGSRSAGGYLDAATKKLVVTVTSRADMPTVRAAGAVPKIVAFDGAELERATAALESTAKEPGTAWAIDPETDQVVLSVDTSVTGMRLVRVTSAAERLGSRVRIEYVPGVFHTEAAGTPVYGGRCTPGFNVRRGGTYYFLTAGHCGNLTWTWYADAARTRVLGTTSESRFPGEDVALVRYAGAAAPAGTAGEVDITGAGDAYVGESVTRQGGATGTRTGTVVAVNETVNYPEGTVYGMIQATACAENGDSGGPLHSGGTAVGLTSGGSGNCAIGGTTFFQPVPPALAAFGVSIY